MRGFECSRNFACNRDCLIDGQLALPLETRSERFSIDITHGIPRDLRSIGSIDCSRIHNGNYPGMLKLRGEADLSYKAIYTDSSRELGMKNLDRDQSIVTQVTGKPHRCHAAAAELVLDPVAPCEYRVEVVSHPDSWTGVTERICLAAGDVQL